MSMFGGGLGGFGSNEPDVQSKLAALKAKKRNDPSAGVKQFLEHDLGVDMRQLPFNLTDASQFLHKLCQDESVQGLVVEGNSMGFKHLKLDAPQVDIPCPTCGSNNGWWNEYPTTWYCENCESNSGDDNGTVQVPADKMPKGTVATEDQHGNIDWHDATRTFEALKKHVMFKVDADSVPIPTYSWRVKNGWREATIEAIPPKIVNPDLKHYPTGSVLRIEKHILSENGDVTSPSEYVRIGGLFNDDDVVILSTMQPIAELSGWTVVEEL